MPENPPLQHRAGFNRGEQSNLLLRTRYLGQPAIKAGPGDTIIMKNSPDLPGRGQKNVRTQINNLMIGGWVLNRTGADVEIDYVLLDADGNEFPFFLGGAGGIVVPNGQPFPILQYGYAAIASGDPGGVPLSLLPPGWSFVLRLISGNPSGGKGLIIWPWAQDASNNLQALMVPVTNSGVVLGPAPGRAWQLCSKKKLQAVELNPAYFNFDSITRTVEQGAEIYHLAGEDIPVNAVRPDIVVAPRTDDSSGVRQGFLTEVEFEKKPLGLVLAYPDKIKVKTKEAQKTAPLYLLVPFAEFDLPADMNVEE
jgi:hypothetical protein